MPKDAPTYCVGCFQCILNDENKCAQAEKVQIILDALVRSDILIFDTPTFCYEMTAQLKVLFDHFAYIWMVHRPKKEMFSKIAISISTTAGAGANGVTKSIAKQFSWWGISNIYRLPFKVKASKWDDVSTEMKNIINKKTDNIAKKVKRKIGKTKTNFKTKFTFTIMRKLHNIKSWNKVDKEFWLQKGWLGKARPWNNK